MDRRPWQAAVALLSLVVFGFFLLYTARIVREVRTESRLHTRMYAQVQQGLLSLEPGAELQALVTLQATLTELGVPVVAVNAEGEPYAVANLPFEVDLNEAADRQRILRYTRALDRQNQPISVPASGTIHFGVPPIIGWLRWVPWLQAGSAIGMVLLGWIVLRAGTRAERERTWSVMARELAHQMGTPLTSLAGWIEVLRLPAEERAALAAEMDVAQHIAADLERLERVSHRFELIGTPPALEPVQIDAVMAELLAYLQPRLPRLSGGVDLRVRVRRQLPALRANRTLLVWALENLVKNALDALAGRRGAIRIAVARTATGRVQISVADTGPGIAPEVRRRLFQPGVTTKPGGWGVGLSLTRRIVEDLHGGRISCRARRGGGTLFELELPTMDEPPRPRRTALRGRWRERSQVGGVLQG